VKCGDLCAVVGSFEEEEDAFPAWLTVPTRDSQIRETWPSGLKCFFAEQVVSRVAIPGVSLPPGMSRRERSGPLSLRKFSSSVWDMRNWVLAASGDRARYTGGLGGSICWENIDGCVRAMERAV